jgi:hypothetical protein
MAVKRVIKGAHVVRIGKANAFLIGGDDRLTLIDAGRQRSSGDPRAWPFARPAQAPNFHSRPA